MKQVPVGDISALLINHISYGTEVFFYNVKVTSQKGYTMNNSIIQLWKTGFPELKKKKIGWHGKIMN
jgi:hypothetical protein